jgi:membrane protease YdiL (CAAX protease family)
MINMGPHRAKVLPARFFLLVVCLSLPFYLAGALTSFQLLPGLPVSSLILVCPVTAALILVQRESQTPGIKGLLKRSFDYKRTGARIWYLPTILLMPAIMVLSYIVQQSTGGSLPAPQISVLGALALCCALFVAALGEELGFSGYVIDPMQDRWGALGASILLGSFWALWHIVPLVEASRSPSWIAGWCVGTVAARTIIVWLYNNTGRSVFAAALFHATINITWQLFPINGSFYDPGVTGLITAAVAVIIVVVWGPRTLVRGSRYLAARADM